MPWPSGVRNIASVARTFSSPISLPTNGPSTVCSPSSREAEFDEERFDGLKIVDDDEDVVHSVNWHFVLLTTSTVPASSPQASVGFVVAVEFLGLRSNFSFRPTVIAMLLSWQIAAVWWPTSAGANGCSRDLTASRKVDVAGVHVVVEEALLVEAGRAAEVDFVLADFGLQDVRVAGFGARRRGCG